MNIMHHLACKPINSTLTQAIWDEEKLMWYYILKDKKSTEKIYVNEKNDIEEIIPCR